MTERRHQELHTHVEIVGLLTALAVAGSQANRSDDWQAGHTAALVAIAAGLAIDPREIGITLKREGE